MTTSFANTLLASLPSLPVPSNGTLGSLINASPVQGVSSNLNRLQVALSKFIGSTDSDQEHLNGLAALSSIIAARDGESTKRAYMGAVSPWFFTHYGANSFNKNVSHYFTHKVTGLTTHLVHFFVRPAPIFTTMGVCNRCKGPI